MAKFEPKGGNLLEIRGLAGTVDRRRPSTTASSRGSRLTRNSRSSSSVTGDWDQTTAQKAVATVLPSLPPIVGVVDQGGDGYGAAQAFAAAGKPRPTIIKGNRQDELQWWKEQKDKDGYKTWSASIAPGVSTLAFWVAQQVLDGKKVPHDLLVPYLAFTQDDFEKELPNIPKGGVASHEYTQADAIAAIKANDEVAQPDERRASQQIRPMEHAGVSRRFHRRRKILWRRPGSGRRRFFASAPASASASSAITAPASRR